MAARKLTGKTQPRLWTPPQRTLTRRTSLGYEVADFASIIGEPFLPWQRWLAIHALEPLPDRTPRFRVVLAMVGRQNGKSSFKRTISLYRLYVTGARLVLGVAQDVSLAREQQNYCLETVQASPYLAEDLAQVRRAAGDERFRVAGDLDYEDGEGDESFTLAGGGRYKIAASNRKAGRGLSVDELNIDELHEWHNFEPWSALYYTTMARPAAMIWALSNAGDDRSVVLNQLRDAALSGRDPSIGLFEWSAPDNCDLDDTGAWRQANPGLGYTVSEAAIRTASISERPDVFRTEVLCQKVDQLDGAVNYTAWQACHDPAGTMDSLRGRLAACFDIAPDGGHATLAVAARLDDGRARVEIAGAWKTTEQARAELPGLLARIRPRAIAWYPAGPGGAFATVLRPPGALPPPRGPEYVELAGGRVPEVCMEFADLVRARQVVHSGDEILDTHIRSAGKLGAGDAWRFQRKGGGHVDAAYSAAGAISTALLIPAARRARIRVLNAG